MMAVNGAAHVNSLEVSTISREIINGGQNIGRDGRDQYQVQTWQNQALLVILVNTLAGQGLT